MSDKLAIIQIVVEAVLGVVLIAAMTLIILSPASDEISKAALVVVSAAVGFLFGRKTSGG